MNEDRTFNSRINILQRRIARCMIHVMGDVTTADREYFKHIIHECQREIDQLQPGKKEGNEADTSQ